jgi:hypothetical protein
VPPLAVAGPAVPTVRTLADAKGGTA